MSADKSKIILHYNARAADMLSAICNLVASESPSHDLAALTSTSNLLKTYLTTLVGQTPTLHLDQGRPHLELNLGPTTDVLVIGHFDTVHPIGTLLLNPIRTEAGKLYGPGTLDMKAGVVAMAEIARYFTKHHNKPNITFFFNSDEEISSPSSRKFLQQLAQQAKIILVFDFGDPSGALKDSARGVRQYKVTIKGKGGHAAYPEINHNPVEALSDILKAIKRYHQPDQGVVVVPTKLSASNTINAVADLAEVFIDTRGQSEEQLDKIQKGLTRIRSQNVNLSITTDLVGSIPTFSASSLNKASLLASEAASLLSWDPLKFITARGASDANHLAAVSPSILDGLGGWGNGAHSSTREYVELTSVTHSAILVTTMLELYLTSNLGSL